MATLQDVTVERLTGMDVGCKRDAIAACEGRLREIGSGAQRTVFVDSRNRFVYKLENGSRWAGSNRDEYVAFTSGRLGEIGLGQYGSPVAMFTVRTDDGMTVEVLAMPYRPEPSHRADDAERRRASSRGLFDLPDMHGANYRVTANGRIKVTDLGFGIRR